jgi:hypothetical protein
MKKGRFSAECQKPFAEWLPFRKTNFQTPDSYLLSGVTSLVQVSCLGGEAVTAIFQLPAFKVLPPGEAWPHAKATPPASSQPFPCLILWTRVQQNADPVMGTLACSQEGTLPCPWLFVPRDIFK